jgi:hypothetical protein
MKRVTGGRDWYQSPTPPPACPASTIGMAAAGRYCSVGCVEPAVLVAASRGLRQEGWQPDIVEIERTAGSERLQDACHTPDARQLSSDRLMLPPWSRAGDSMIARVENYSSIIWRSNYARQEQRFVALTRNSNKPGLPQCVKTPPRGAPACGISSVVQPQQLRPCMSCMQACAPQAGRCTLGSAAVAACCCWAR